MGLPVFFVSLSLLAFACVYSSWYRNRVVFGLNRNIFTPRPLKRGPLVSVIIPARNEEANIAAILESLVRQKYPDMEVIVVDDASEDATGRIASGFAAGDPRVRVVSPGPVPAGWTGKNNACREGVLSARGEYLLFMDADAALTSDDAVSGMVEISRRESIDLLSFIPRQGAETFWERVLQPSVFLLIALRLMPLCAVNDPADRRSAAIGQCLFFKRSGYDALGGHEAVKGEITEDLALARLVKERGMRLVLLNGVSIISVRMYRSFSDLWRGWTKHLYMTVSGTFSRMLWRTVAYGLGFLSPAILLAAAIVYLAIYRDRWSAVIALLSFGIIAISSRQWLKHYERMGWPRWYLMTFPLGMSMTIVMLWASFVRCRIISSVSWKGRSLAPTAEPAKAKAAKAAKAAPVS